MRRCAWDRTSRLITFRHVPRAIASIAGKAGGGIFYSPVIRCTYRTMLGLSIAGSAPRPLPLPS